MECLSVVFFMTLKERDMMAMIWNDMECCCGYTCLMTNEMINGMRNAYTLVRVDFTTRVRRKG